MASTAARHPSRPPNGGASENGTPQTPSTRSKNINPPMPDLGPLRDPAEARKWLETKSWILAGEPYECTKLTRIIATAIQSTNTKNMKLDTDNRNAIIAATVLLEEYIQDAGASTIADTVADKVLDRVGKVVEDITKSAGFVAATSTAQANTTLSLQEITNQLQTVTTNLKELSNRLPQSPPTNHPSSYAGVTGSKPSTGTRASPQPFPSQFNPIISVQHTKLQQRIQKGARTILIHFESNTDVEGFDKSIKGLSEARQRLNKALAGIDKTTADLAAVDGVPPSPAATIIKGISILPRGDILLEFDTAESAARFRAYDQEDDWQLVKNALGASAQVLNKPFNLIVRFVPCYGVFDPDDPEHLRTMELENGLQKGSISSARWLVKPENRRVNQDRANIKLTCSSEVAANRLLAERIHIGGLLVVVEKDIREPIRCNKCQQYGHVRAKCTNDEHCGSCSSTSHTTKDCPVGSASRCVTCGPDSNHASTARTCPTFKKRCNDLNSRYPENAMPFFPTEDPATWITNPKKTSHKAPTPTPFILSQPPSSSQPNPTLTQSSVLDFFSTPHGAANPSASQ